MFGFLKKQNEYVELEPKGVQNKNKILILLVFTAILILAFGNIGKKDVKTPSNEVKKNNEISTAQYIAESESRLEEILSSVQGVGKVKAMITVEDIGEKVLATDKKSETSQSAEKEKNSRNSNQEQTAVVLGSGSEEQPFVLKEKLPVPAGVLVVASGAGAESVRLDVYEAVRALFGISGHRIKVVKGNFD